MKNDKSKKLFDAVDGIGDDLLREAASYDARRVRRNRFIRYGAVAALFVMISAVALTLVLRKGDTATNGAPVVPIEFSGNEVYSATAGTSLPDALKSVSVRTNTDGKIIPTSENFIIETSDKCDSETVAQYMNISPKMNVSLTKNSDTEFVVTPSSGTLFPGTVYNISFGDPDNPASSFSFQTESEFFVKSVLPADMSTSAPVDTGIEITFSEAIDEATVKGAITIEPSVDFEYELYSNGKVLAIIPDDDLEAGTVYKVTVAQSVKSASGRGLKEEKAVSFRTALSAKEDDSDSSIYISTSKYYPSEYGNFRYSVNREEYVYSEGDGVAVSFSLYNNFYNGLANVNVDATLYKYASFDDALAAITDSAMKEVGFEGVTYSTKGLDKVGKFEVTYNKDSYTDSGVISFPATLGRGAYLAEIVASSENRFGDRVGATKYIVIQVSDLSAFTLSSDGKTLIRVDSKTGSADGAEVEYSSFERVYWYSDRGEAPNVVAKGSTTVKGGVCTFDNGDADSAIITIRKGDDAVALCVLCQETDENEYAMSAVYTDREVYFSNDTINFSGFAKAIGGEIPRTLYVKTADSAPEEIEVASGGSFKGSIKIENRGEGGFFISIVDAEERTVASKWVRVTEESKPQITATVSFDRLFYRFGETVTATVHASFFDGTPAEEFTFEVSSYPFGYGATLTTDRDGNAEYVFETGVAPDPWSTDPISLEVSAELVNFESQTLYVSNSVYYFHSDYVFKAVRESERRALTLNHVDTSSVKTEDDLSPDVFPENTVGDAAEGSVNYVLEKVEIITTETKKYDYIAKRTYTDYTYRTVETPIASGTYTFEDGVIELPMMKVEGFDGYYYYEISYNDGRNTYDCTVSAVENDYYERTSAYDASVTLNAERYRVGDEIGATFTVNGAEQKNVLFAIYADGLETYGVGDSFKATFEGAMTAGAEIFAVAYDSEAGEYLFADEYLLYDYEHDALDIEIIPDREVYSPGDEATVKVIVKDAPGASLTLSIVDEACFALGDQDENTAETYFTSARRLEKDYKEYYYYYWWYDYPYYRVAEPMKRVCVNRRFSCSEMIQDDLPDGNNKADYEAFPEAQEDSAEAPTESTGVTDQSGGDGVYIRSYFADNPLFELISLDGNGETTLVFTVPDNITSWRLTAVAVDSEGKDFGDVRVGNSTTDVICTKDFFMNLSAPEYFIKGDDACILARTFGAASDGVIDYTATVANEESEVVASCSVSDNSKGYAELNFGKLPIGHYTATVIARGGDSSDGMTSEFDVIASAEVMTDRRTVTPDEIKSLAPALYPVTLTFFNESASSRLLNYILQDYFFIDDTSRSDMLAASYAAKKASSEIFSSPFEEDEAFMEKFKDYCGELISVLTYSEGDVRITAEIASAVPEIIDPETKSRIISYIKDMLDDGEVADRMDLTSALAALAALNEPVLDVLYNVSASAGEYPVEAKLYLASAFASIGDWTAARDIYLSLKSELGVENTEYATLKFKGANNDETVRFSSLALLVASRIDKADAAKLARYLIENPSDSEPVYTAMASFIRYYMPDADYSEKSVTYRIGDVETTETLRPWESVTVKLSKSSLENFEIVSIDEDVSIEALYTARAEDVLKKYDVSDRVTVTKTIEPSQNELYVVTLTVSGTSTRVSECFDLTDQIPSGARFFESYGNTTVYNGNSTVHTGAYVYNPSTQKIKGSAWVYNGIYNGDWRRTECPEYSFSVSVSYVIRGAVTGEFIAEPAVIRNLGGGVYNTSERYTVKITKDDWIIKEYPQN